MTSKIKRHNFKEFLAFLYLGDIVDLEKQKVRSKL